MTDDTVDRDGLLGMAWWNGLHEDVRAKWGARAGTGVAADAWALFKNGDTKDDAPAADIAIIWPICDDCARANPPPRRKQHYGWCTIGKIKRACFGVDLDPLPPRKKRKPSDRNYQKAAPVTPIEAEDFPLGPQYDLADGKCQCDHDAGWLRQEIAARRLVHEYRTNIATGKAVLVCTKCQGLWDHAATDRLMEPICEPRPG
jgi:hypothetical protein